MMRSVVTILALLLLASSTFGWGSVAAEEPPLVTPAEFVVPSDPPPPLPTLSGVTSCSGEQCNGTDPRETGCDIEDYPGVTFVEVTDAAGNRLGTLYLRSNHFGCDSTQWALFTRPEPGIVFNLRVVQNHTGLATEWARFGDSPRYAWSAQLHSPNEAVRAEVIVYDSTGDEIARDVTNAA